MAMSRKAEPAEEEDTFPRDIDALARELKRRLREMAADQHRGARDRARHRRRSPGFGRDRRVQNTSLYSCIR